MSMGKGWLGKSQVQGRRLSGAILTSGRWNLHISKIQKASCREVGFVPSLALQRYLTPRAEATLGRFVLYVLPDTTMHVGTRCAQLGAQGLPFTCIALSLLNGKSWDGSTSLHIDMLTIWFQGV